MFKNQETMKTTKILSLLLFAIVLASCNQSKKENSPSEKATMENPAEQEMSREYPEEMSQVFKTHGGMDTWNSMNTLKFEIVKPEGNESQVIDLKNRNTRITTKEYAMGSDAEGVWVKNEAGEYKGNAEFYHNLMFYFYAMPFVLGDEGINYENTEAITYEGTSYPGVRISFNDGVGASPKDEYYLYYDQDFQMAWLGYTVTYQSGEPSDKISMIKYEDWQEVSGLKLPKTLSWYTYQDGVIGEKRNSVNFANVFLSKEQMPKEEFKMPEGGKVFEKQAAAE